LLYYGVQLLVSDELMDPFVDPNLSAKCEAKNENATKACPKFYINKVTKYWTATNTSCVQ